ncbi:hypothetical protein KP509_21G009400 [Ceratopteris richardii]|uniref:Uncharacterized protein n=2 Tax=Ceratopteris richardii TaxID=49495 RepID=A0A8T2S7L0_CERRI|nr:hypothetical protein KP509_21G009400 [Ceratopteris richardii]KAH7314567.1 hypothetical protein KP509_21G009400 [Ceratopteris richardii]KAH7314568.1 hypothetical protein KP509_21G009400 [Ceratopteris richardii]KAH7314569.1 hypothetical protein KP509_21G009400 [Ceratopteris richardii]
MEARSKSVGARFPGYDGPYPKAMRTSRGRSDHIRRKSGEGSELPKDTCFFELLAAVAGQILQEQDGSDLNERSLLDLGAPKVSVEFGNDNSIMHDISSDDTRRPDITFHPKKEEIITMDRDPEHSTHTLQTKYDSSTHFSLDNSDPLASKSQDFKYFPNSIKATYFPRKRETPTEFSFQGSAAMACIESKLKNGTSDISLCQSEQCIPKANEGKLENMVVDRSTVLKDSSAQEIKQRHAIDMTAPFQMITDSPPLVSSGSSEETPFTSEPKSYLTSVFEPIGQDGAKRGFSSWKSSENDSNSSDSMFSKNCLTKSVHTTDIRALKLRRCTASTAKRRAMGVGYRRKRCKVEDGEASQNEIARSARKKANKFDCMLPDIETEKQLHALEGEKISSISSSSVTSSSTKLDDTNVKLSIKSFIVPELMVVLPESATVANLKKAVMDAAMNLLGGGLCVRVLLQGKKVTDELKSLRQAGISTGGDLDSLDFMLEPNSLPTPGSVEDTFLVLSHDANHPTSRYPVLSKDSEFNAASFHGGTSKEFLRTPDGCSEMQSTTASPTKEAMENQSNVLVLPAECALVLHSSQKYSDCPNGLAVVPFSQNPGGVGSNKRRMRRPFSVAEVEVLVQAVERLGTGRWRDVKQHAFPQAKHRTYVDLKDKWKTLVHTASIAPHQRRGEPVPQGLLDRVIQAHSYWTAQQAKHQGVEVKAL